MSDWSSYVCSSDLNIERRRRPADDRADRALRVGGGIMDVDAISPRREQRRPGAADQSCANAGHRFRYRLRRGTLRIVDLVRHRSEEHTSELQSLMRISYAVFCLKKKKK